MVKCRAARVYGAVVRGAHVGNECELAGVNHSAERKVGGNVTKGRVPVTLARKRSGVEVASDDYLFVLVTEDSRFKLEESLIEQGVVRVTGGWCIHAKPDSRVVTVQSEGAHSCASAREDSGETFWPVVHECCYV